MLSMVLRMLRVRPCCLVSLLVLVAASLGCGKQDPNRGQVTGAVEVDGQPVAKGSIDFKPIDGNSATTSGDIIDGRYTVNANIGPSKVAINIPKVVGERKLYDTPDSPVRPVFGESLPPQYNEQTTLTYDVKPGENEQNFSLKTK
jgi:hypothetical protein